MTQRPMATLATILGVIAILAIFFPWYAAGVKGQGGYTTTSGVGGDYMGKITVVVAALGVACLAWFSIAKTGPGLSKSLLILALFGFAAASALMVVDVLREVESREVAIRGGAYTAGRQVGIYIALGAALGAFLATLVTMLRPRTSHVD